MSRNRDGRFSLAPQVNISRSKFPRPFEHCTTCNVGEVIPIFVDEILPGDTAELRTTFTARLQTLIAPIMTNMYIDTYYYFVPNRLVWKHWKEFCGENSTSAWIPQVQYSTPQLTTPSGGTAKGTILDHMGVPTGIGNLSLNALPVRAYAKIMSEFFRDENLQDPLSIPDDDTTVIAVNTGTEVTDVAKGGMPFKAAKFHDYFTSALPGPQKSDPVMVQTIAQGATMPVWATSNLRKLADAPAELSGERFIGKSGLSSATIPIKKTDFTGANLHDGTGYGGLNSSSGFGFYGGSTSSPVSGVNAIATPSNLWAYVPENLAAVSVNTLRLAFAIQRIAEKDSRTGSRYTEILKGHFGITSPDARIQRPEYLGGHRVRINVNQVVQTSESGLTTPQGNVAGYSLTTDSHGDFIKSFSEHGFIIGVAVVRYDHLYQQGLERFWSRKDRFDYYWPSLVGIGEQGIKNREIYAQGDSVVDSDGNIIDDQIFGYQEAWADYRYKPSLVSSEMRSNYAQSLDVWHLADDYNALPTLSESWIKEDSATVDRVVAVSQRLSDQVLLNFFFDYQMVRPMPVYSIPGLIDHF